MEELQFLADVVGLTESLIAVAGVGIGMVGTLMFGRRYKQRIAALEAEAARPAITQTFNFNVSSDRERQMLDAIDAATVQGLRETINGLTQHSLGDGHTYAELPHGTNIVMMADGTMQLALPVRLEAHLRGVGAGSASLIAGDAAATEFRAAEARWLHQPGVGREAARLIMMAPTFQEAEAVHDTFSVADKRLDAPWAHHAFLYRLEMEGRSDEVMSRAEKIGLELGDDFIVDTEDEGWQELQALYLKRRDDG